MKPLIVDALAMRDGKRWTTLDVIGAGPRTIAGIFEEYGMEPKITTLEFYQKTVLRDYDVLLISGMTVDTPTVRRVTRKWQKTSRKPVLIGGPITSDPLRSLKKTSADVGIIGEGEETLRNILDYGLRDAILPDEEILNRIKGISYSIGKEVRFNGYRPIMEKDEYIKNKPSTRAIRDYPLFHAARVYVEILRGCSNYHRSTLGPIGEKCTKCEKCFEGELDERFECCSGIPPGCGYCSVPSLFGPPKSRPVDLILDEVSQLINEGVHRIVLSAPGFLDYKREALVSPQPLTNPRSPEPNYKALEELLSRLCSLEEIKSGQVSFIIENIKSVLVTNRASKILGKYLKNTPVSIGFETGSRSHSWALGRPNTPKETYRSINRLNRAGMKPYVYFIHGLPGQTKETTDATVKAIKKSVRLGSDRIILYRFQSLPMSAFTFCPSGPPSANDPMSRRIYDAAKDANNNLKNDLIGSKITVIVAIEYNRNHKYVVAYPMKHGPVVLLEDANHLIGEIVTVKIIGVASERMVYGEVQSLSFKERI
jgi:radical SAM superfamily enzyme YgiQ (UPF0313 family)